ncbi:hypothetical protein PRIEUP_LOCUS384 [Pristimantis euphronides]
MNLIEEEGSPPAACPSGRLLDNAVGSIASPGFPYGYTGGLICSWVISTTFSNALIKIMVEHLSMKESVNCMVESLSFYREENNVHKMCGFHSTPVTYKSRGPLVRVVFISVHQGIYSRNGFSLQYKIYGGRVKDFMETGWRKSRTWENCCDVIETSENGVISSPRYPAEYSNDLRCEWRIIAPLGSIIRLDIDSLSTEKDELGCQDVLHVYQGLSESKVLLGETLNISTVGFRRTEFEQLFSFAMENLLRHWVFSKSRRFIFCMICFSSGCPIPKALRAGSSDLKSPGYPGSYLSGLDRWWIISSLSGKQIAWSI